MAIIGSAEHRGRRRQNQAGLLDESEQLQRVYGRVARAGWEVGVDGPNVLPTVACQLSRPSSKLQALRACGTAKVSLYVLCRVRPWDFPREARPSWHASVEVEGVRAPGTR